MCVKLLSVKFVCVKFVLRRRRREEEKPGIQNQKQEPHTKMWGNIGFRASAISQKRISCETFSKTPSATPPPAPLAIPFTVREQFLC